jgi:hypothetical protein
MSFYSAVLFIHIVGALTLLMAFTIEWTSLLHVQRAATPDQARAWINVSSGIRPLSIDGTLSIVAPAGNRVREDLTVNCHSSARLDDSFQRQKRFKLTLLVESFRVGKF